MITSVLEEMCHAIKEVNKRTDIKNLVLFSTDISAMYPSLDVPEVARVAAELWEESDLELNLDTEELSLYLAVTMKRGELEELGLGDVTHTRLKKGGASPGITTKEVISRQPSTKSLFKKPLRRPTRNEETLMFKLAFRNMIIVAMSEHMYSFNGEIRKQQSGVAIGNVLGGALAVLYTVYFCRKYTERIIEATRNIPDFNLFLMKIYIDDNNVSCESLPPGSRLIDGMIQIVESEVESDKEIPGDLRTSKILLELGNSISHLTLTSDCPSQHPSHFMPILDLQCTVTENKILFKFFKKPMANPILMTKSSAMPYQVKRASLAQEAP